MMDKIVEGKKRKILGIATTKKKMRKVELKPEIHTAMREINIDREALLEEEMAKLPKLEQSNALVQTHTGNKKGNVFIVFVNVIIVNLALFNKYLFILNHIYIVNSLSMGE